MSKPRRCGNSNTQSGYGNQVKKAHGCFSPSVSSTIDAEAIPLARRMLARDSGSPDGGLNDL